MDIMELESVMLRLSQKPRPMLSMDMVLGTALILWDMAMDILATLPRRQGRCSLWIWSWAPHLFFGTWLWTSWLLFPWLWSWIWSSLWHLWRIWSWTPCLWLWKSWLLFSWLWPWIWSWTPHLFSRTWLWTSWLWPWIWSWLWHIWIWKAEADALYGYGLGHR